MDALILAGGVAKGAFTGGALRALLDPSVNPHPARVRRIVAASSGALNAAYVASALARGRGDAAGLELEALWLEHATAARTFDPTLAGIVGLEGFSSGDKLRALLRDQIRPARGTHPIDLRLVVTTTTGEVCADDAPPATTFEHVLRFDEGDFETASGLEDVFAGVVASAAFPVAFLPAPVHIDGRAVPCFDGGLVNNCPVRHAIGDPSIGRVFVISPYPRVAFPSPADEHGAGLLAHLADVLVNERLYRDVREARAVNRALARLEDEFPTAFMRERVLAALGWDGRRRIEIVEIRPAFPLAGSAFDGFFSRSLRESYLRAGEDAARAWVRCPIAA